MSAVHKAIKRRHARRELVKHGLGLLLVFGAPVAGLVGATIGLAWARHVPVLEMAGMIVAAL